VEEARKRFLGMRLIHAALATGLIMFGLVVLILYGKEMSVTPLYAPRIFGSRSVRGQARTVDMLPTLLDLLGLPPSEAPISGVSLADAATKTGAIEPSLAFFARNRDFVDCETLPGDPAEVYSEFGCCNDKVKVLMDAHSGAQRAFNLRTDPGETAVRSVAELGAEVLGSALRDEARRASVGRHDPADYRRLRERLQSLGYL